jgi:hypothetical protein
MKRKLYKQENQKVDMSKKSSLNLRFLKINYLNNLNYYIKDKNPKEIFTSKLINFFKENFENHSIFTCDGIGYSFGAVEIGKNYIFGKLWKLKKKQEKDYPWNGKDYEIKPQLGDDFHFSYFYIETNTKHLIIQDEKELTSEKIIEIICSWFDDFNGISSGMDIEYLKSKKDFFDELKSAYKISSAKFILYPSNFDSDELSRDTDKALHDFGVTEWKQEIKSNEGINFTLAEDFTMTNLSGYDYIQVRSSTLGSQTNVSANSISSVSPKPTGHIYVINEYMADGGSDIESDELFRKRIKEKPLVK